MTAQKHDLVTPYMAMEIPIDNNMLMTSPTSSHLMLNLRQFNLGVVDLICTPYITCRQDTTNVNIIQIMHVGVTIRRVTHQIVLLQTYI